MPEPIHTLNLLLPFLYACSLGVYTYDFYADKKSISNWKRIFLFITLLIHVFYLVARTLEYDHPPITNKFEIFSVIAFSISFSYFLLELITDIRGTGSLIILFSFLFQTISSFFIPNLYIVPEILKNRLLGLHVINALLGYSAITISAVYGVLYLLLYKNIKTNKFGLLFNRLPSLEFLERLNYISLIIGFILLTIAISIGTIWLPGAFPSFNYYDPKLIGTFLVWIFYGYGLIRKLTTSWYGKKVIVYSLYGFAFAMASLIVTNTLAKTFHSFY